MDTAYAAQHFCADVVQDARYTVRGWCRSPIVTITAILTLVIGVGATTAVFSVVNAVMFRPLPYPHAERLVEVFEDHQGFNQPYFRVSALNYTTWAERAKSFEAMAAFNNNAFNLTDDSNPERVSGSVVTSSLFRVLGLSPILGRPLQAQDESPGAPPVALISESLWHQRFDSDPRVIDRTVTLNGEPHHIVGVVPRAFKEVGRSQISAIEDPQVFVPFVIDPFRANRGNRVARVVGRLRAGVSLDAARQEMRAVAVTMEQEFPGSNKGWGIRLEHVDDSMFDPVVRTSLLVLLGAVGVVLVIASANVANLLLARAASRQRELALRTALGAERGRLVRQLLTESVCLAVISGVAGVGTAAAGMRVFPHVLPQSLPRIDEVRMDGVVLVFGLGASLVSGLLFGIVPIIRATRVSPVVALMQAGRGIAGSPGSAMRHGLVTAQVGLATTLLVAAMLLLQSFVRLQNVPLGFDPGGVITARVGLSRPEQASGFYDQLLRSLESMPQIEAVATATSAPFTPGVRRSVTLRDVRRAPAPAVEHIVSSGFFETLRIPLRAGRLFSREDRRGEAAVVIVNDILARQLWPGENPIGQVIDRDGQPHRVVGVVGNVQGSDERRLDRRPGAAIYLSADQFPQQSMILLVRANGDSASIAPALRSAVLAIDSTLPMYQVRTLDDWLNEAAAQPQFTTTLATIFALLALVLAAVGIYGVVSYSVSQRTAEMGLRMAIGAASRQVLMLVLRTGMTWVGVGIVLGLAGALVISRLLANLLFEVQPHDVVTLGLVGMTIALISAGACYIPARRAARVDPLVALRYE